MMLKQLLIAGLAFIPTILAAATPPTIGQVTAANEALAQEVQGVDAKVQELTTENAQKQAGRVPNYINDISKSIQGAQAADTGVVSNNDEGTEEAYADSYSNLNDEIVNFLADVRAQQTILTDNDKANATYTALGNLKTTLEDYQKFTAGNVQTTIVQDQIDQSAAQGISAASEAANDFQPPA